MRKIKNTIVIFASYLDDNQLFMKYINSSDSEESQKIILIGFNSVRF